MDKNIKFLPDNKGALPTILAVDDQAINRMLLSNQLRLVGLPSELAEDAPSALEKWKSGRFALLITDCHMPDMDGFQLAQEIRRIESEQQLAPIPIIAWTASDIADEADLRRASGMNDVLPKPATPEQLAMLLAKYLCPTSNPPTAHKEQAPNTNEVDLPLDYAILKKTVAVSSEQHIVLRDFYSHLRRDYAKLIPFLAKGDFVELEKLSHRMKGSCVIVGASKLVASLVKVERAARLKDLAEIGQVSVELARAYGELEAYFIQIGVVEKQVELQHKD